MPETLATEIKKLNQYLHQNPSSMLFARLADRYLALQEIEKAIDICTSGLRHHPNYASAYFVLAKCFFARKQYDEAERRLKRVISLEPSFLNAHKLYSVLMAEIGWIQSSHASLRKIHEIDPCFPIDVEAEEDAVHSESKRPPAPEPAAPEPAEMDSIMDEYPLGPLPSAEEADEEPVLTEPLQETVAAPTLEEEMAMDLPMDDFEKEEARFSEILDDLFSPRIAEEEQRQSETRTIIERAVREEKPFTPPKPPRPAEPMVPAPKKSAGDRPSGPAPSDKSTRPIPEEPIRDRRSHPRIETSKPSIDLTAQKAPKAPLREEAPLEDPFALRPEELQPFESEAKDFTNFLSALDDVSEAEEGLSFDAELSRADDRFVDEPPSRETESTLSTDTDEADARINAKSRSEKPKEKFVTPTLGEIYAAQGQYAKAISVFELLLKKNPENEWYKTKLEYLRKKNQESRS